MFNYDTVVWTKDIVMEQGIHLLHSQVVVVYLVAMVLTKTGWLPLIERKIRHVHTMFRYTARRYHRLQDHYRQRTVLDESP